MGIDLVNVAHFIGTFIVTFFAIFFDNWVVSGVMISICLLVLAGGAGSAFNPSIAIGYFFLGETTRDEFIINLISQAAGGALAGICVGQLRNK